MPKVKPLIKPDPLEDDVISEIAAGMALKNLNIKGLSDRAGINYSTLITRIGMRGDIKRMTIGELIKIRKALRG